MTSDLSVRRRLHPAEIVLAALDNLRELLIAAVAGFVVGGGPGGLGAPLALLLGSIWVTLLKPAPPRGRVSLAQGPQPQGAHHAGAH